MTRGESTYSVNTGDTYVEEEPRTIDWIRDLQPTRTELAQYCRNLFPFTKWILRYNAQWLAGDLVAGITIGAVVVPQGMAYAKLAELPVQYGLYSSFMGVPHLLVLRYLEGYHHRTCRCHVHYCR